MYDMSSVKLHVGNGFYSNFLEGAASSHWRARSQQASVPLVATARLISSTVGASEWWVEKVPPGSSRISELLKLAGSRFRKEKRDEEKRNLLLGLGE